MRGSEEANVAPFDAELAVAFPVRTAKVPLFLVATLEPAIGLRAPVATTDPASGRTMYRTMSEWSEGWAAKALLARLFRGLPITPAGTPDIASLAGVTLA